MKIQEIYEKVIGQEGQKIKNTNAYLVHIFIIPTTTYDIQKDELTDENTEYQVGFYNKETHKISSLKLFQGSIEFMPEEEIFQREDNELYELELSDVKIDLEDAIRITRETIAEKFPKTMSLKTIVILQNIISYGFVWNITILRRDFKTLNIKIDAKTGMIKHTSCESLIDLEKSSRKSSDEK